MDGQIVKIAIQTINTNEHAAAIRGISGFQKELKYMKAFFVCTFMSSYIYVCMYVCLHVRIHTRGFWDTWGASFFGARSGGNFLCGPGKFLSAQLIISLIVER